MAEKNGFPYQIPKIVEFLGYDPWPVPDALAERIAYFRHRGLTQEDLASALRVHPATVHRWENGLTVPETKLIGRLEQLLRMGFSPTPQ